MRARFSILLCQFTTNTTIYMRKQSDIHDATWPMRHFGTTRITAMLHAIQLAPARVDRPEAKRLPRPRHGDYFADAFTVHRGRAADHYFPRASRATPFAPSAGAEAGRYASARRDLGPQVFSLIGARDRYRRPRHLLLNRKCQPQKRGCLGLVFVLFSIHIDDASSHFDAITPAYSLKSQPHSITSRGQYKISPATHGLISRRDVKR